MKEGTERLQELGGVDDSKVTMSSRQSRVD